eukprot:TRINITY_DN122_c0_g1_i2.p1 TRINITY_DN122_c0_g1~~TRINITY_DN122_c0_g1_i2.p1  ORF type:complete len:670 (+),score=329.37 TRINITY_DN122_c0_g1_i2:54-2063(+)
MAQIQNQEILIMEKERNNFNFNVRELTYILQGGKENTERNEFYASIIEKEPIFHCQNSIYLSREQKYALGLSQTRKYLQLIKEHNLTREEALVLKNYITEPLGFDTHRSMYTPTLEGQASSEQQQKWLTEALEYNIIGCYAQTELGHGSNVRAIETIAVYDKTTKEFILNTPTLTAIKWWPGGLGKTANYTIVYARLIIDDKDYGVHSFNLPIRSKYDHSTLAGIELGDIGPKLGFDAVDNGYMKLTNVRIPLENLLNRFAKVDPDGSYTKPIHDKVGYATMLAVRASIITGVSKYLARAITIAIRYSTVRRQGYTESGEERQVIDYQMQQYRLFPILATTYALYFTTKFADNIFLQLKKSIAEKNFSPLQEIHATASGLKALTTWLASDAIEECRKCLGGHGYMLACGLPNLFSRIVPACTYEGDNVVLCNQTARYIIKVVQKSLLGENNNSETFKYLRLISNSNKRWQVNQSKDLENFDKLIELFEVRVRYLALKCNKYLTEEVQSGKSPENAWQSINNELTKLAKAHCYFVMVDQFGKQVQQLKSTISIEIYNVLCILFQLFVLYHLDNSDGAMADLLTINFIIGEQVDLIRNQIRYLVNSLRPHVIALTDAFNFPDYLLATPLGRYDGNVYEHLFQLAKQNPMNSKDVHDGYQLHLKELLVKSKL